MDQRARDLLRRFQASGSNDEELAQKFLQEVERSQVDQKEAGPVYVELVRINPSKENLTRACSFFLQSLADQDENTALIYQASSTELRRKFDSGLSSKVFSLLKARGFHFVRKASVPLEGSVNYVDYDPHTDKVTVLREAEVGGSFSHRLEVLSASDLSTVYQKVFRDRDDFRGSPGVIGENGRYYPGFGYLPYFHPNGKRFIQMVGPTTYRFFNLKSGKPTGPEFKGAGFFLFSSDGKTLISWKPARNSNSESKVWVHNAETGEFLADLDIKDAFELAISPAGNALAIARTEGFSLFKKNAASKTFQFDVTFATNHVFNWLVFQPYANHDVLLGVDIGNGHRYFLLEEETLAFEDFVTARPEDGDGIRYPQFSPDGHLLAITSGDDDNSSTWEVRVFCEGELCFSPPGSNARGYFTRNGSFLMVETEGETPQISLWEWKPVPPPPPTGPF